MDHAHAGTNFKQAAGLENLNNQRQHCSERSTGLSLFQKENGL
jgi:hypothetical protein